MASKRRSKKEIDLLDPKKKRSGKYKPEYVDIIYRFCLLTNATEEDICSLLGVVKSTLYEWKKAYPDLRNAIQRGKQMADGDVAHALYQRAIGYSHSAIEFKVLKQKVALDDGKTGIVDVVKKIETIKHYPPDPIACIFWLKNRDRLNWADRPLPPPVKGGKEISEEVIKKLETADAVEAAKMYEELIK